MNHRTDSVECPKCGAAVGAPCKTKMGRVRFDYPHKARQKAHIKARES